MQYTAVSKELLTGTVLSKLYGDFNSYPQTPERVEETLQFKESAFYNLYRTVWPSFLELRMIANSLMANPEAININDNRVSFLLDTDGRFKAVAPVLAAYFNAIGWKSVRFTSTTHQVKHVDNWTDIINVELSCKEFE